MKLLQQCCICHHSGDLVCHNCLRHLNPHPDIIDMENTPGLTGLIVGRRYTQLVRHLVHRLKYGKGRSVSLFLGSKLANIINTSDLIQQIQLYPGKVIITAVPTHRVKRYLTRGYNQAELLAKSIAKSLDLPYVSLLTKSRRTTSQVRVSNRSKRLTNIINSFSNTTLLSVSSTTNKYKNPEIIVIIDDIITTGATINQCTRTLHQQYPHAQIRGVCIATNR